MYNLHCIDVKIEELKYPIIIMIINRIMERDGRLEDLENKADKLHIDSQQFQVRLYPDYRETKVSVSYFRKPW